VFAAFYTQGQRDGSGRTICIQHMFPDLDSLTTLMHDALCSVPSDVLKFRRLDGGGGCELVLAAELPSPKRVRLPVSQRPRRDSTQAATHELAQHAAGGCDVGRLDGLQAFAGPLTGGAAVQVSSDMS
jgi:hypothetical protein